jgi:hypothetical protein
MLQLHWLLVAALLLLLLHCQQQLLCGLWRLAGSQGD